MTKRSLFFALLVLVGGVFSMDAAKVKVIMNNVSKTMTLQEAESETTVDVGEPTSSTYEFEAPAGKYVLTAYGTDGTTVNGTIVLNVKDAAETQEFKIITCTAYVTNKSNNVAWSVDKGDYTLEVKVNSREGERQTITVGNSTTAGRNTFLAFNGNSYYASFIPSEAHQAEGYVTLYKGGTLTANVNVSGAIPKSELYTVSVPADAEFYLGMKFSHFIDFTPIAEEKVEQAGDVKKITYKLAYGQIYNYRTWKKGGLTQAGYFKINEDPAKTPTLEFKNSDYEAFSPTGINHDVNSNKGYETGDIFVNINERGHLNMKVGETFKAHAMRTWELTDNSTNNYFFEPDFHYTIIGLDGKPSNNVIEISNANTTTSAWSEIKAVGEGTAIVLVTYDAIALNYYNNAEKKPYLGGEIWGAIWPENTAAYVVTVGEGAATITPNMFINEKYNKETLKVAGKNVDAEHDVFYYLDTEEGAKYTFTPEGVTEVTIAYPTIGERMATYTGFGTEGVTKNEDGSYTLLLKNGRQIVKLTDASGKSVYQVLTAKVCHRDITNASRPGSKIFQPGDEVTIQYSGLRHPANKLAGIYNMSAYVTYNGVPNGTSLILGKGQYTFGSAASAQAVTVTIPADHNVTEVPEIVMNEGVIQVNGFGDPIGNHRVIDPVAGRSPNFTAVAHKTYFGYIPDVNIKLSAYKSFVIKLNCDVEGADITLSFDGKALTPAEDGTYEGTYGTYTVIASKPGYRYLNTTYTIQDDAEGVQTFNIVMIKDENCWDGKTQTEPASVDGVYQISNGAELAWLANKVNAEGNSIIPKAVLTQDIDLGGYPWTAIGKSGQRFMGTFDGQGHTVKGLYVNVEGVQYQGLFGYVSGTDADHAIISGVTVEGEVHGKSHSGGLVGYAYQYVEIDRCANFASVTTKSSNAGGIVGYMGHKSSKVTNCYNTGNITGTGNCGGVIGGHIADITVENVFNIGEIAETTTSASCVGSSKDATITNAFTVKQYAVTTGETLVTDSQMASGEVAYKLGEAFGQKIGEQLHPVLGGDKVFYDKNSGTYTNTVGVDGVELEEDGEAVYYNLQGLSSPTPWKGFNIVRTSNGKCKKIFVK